ncbi:ABC-2 type transport system ATP-binding protein [Granulicatella balaenopterae]|uniref:ABC-2 type transport system ATP-binding protein n=1 Tax=Granulicatella balaenopterae TaxID=137733 RepID=A0A1H9HFV6_9LACT|nr:ABC transporter ATP-binding protein [Granulicatella balaenopterae]SEQ61142.1 ABC-2 type transport system ATP-binding protein [Granulicatella balaenopterae]
MIRLTNVSKSYGKKLALSNFSYEFKDQKGYGILGINGAGKSTLIGCITNNLSYVGTIEYLGLTKYDIGYVPQELAIYPELSVLDNLMFFAAIHKMDQASAKKKALELIERTGLQDKTNDLAKNLSGGMKRKLNLITGLIHGPKYLICDEVCVGIDPISRRDILEYIKELQDEGLVVIYTSHYLDEIEFLCDKIIFVNEGHLLLEGSTAEISKEIVGKEDAGLSEIFEKLLRKDGE